MTPLSSKLTRPTSFLRRGLRAGSPNFRQVRQIPTTHATRLQALRTISSTRVCNDGELAELCNANVVTSPQPSIPPEHYNRPLPDFIMSTWKKHGMNHEDMNEKDRNDSLLSEELAIFDGSTGMQRTFREYYENTKGLAGSLKYDLGVDKNTCVCLFAPNHVDYLPVTLAVGLTGSRITPVNPLYKSNELEMVLNKSKSSVLIAHKSNLDVALQAAKGAKNVRHILVMTEDGEVTPPGGIETLESLTKHSQGFDSTEDSFDCKPKSHPYLLPYSSGTTGLPKGVCLTHANLTVNILQMKEVEGPSLGKNNGLFSPLPFFHIYGLVVSLMFCGWMGTPVYTMSERFDFELMLKMIQEHRPTNAHLVPPILLGLAKSPQVNQYDLSSLKSIITAAAPLGSDTETDVQNRIRCHVKQAWGMSELSPIGTLSPSATDIPVGSVGTLVSNTSGKILDASGKSLGPHEAGELVIKGPQVMMGYLDEQEQTKKCLSSTGWLRTGDLAYYDEKGNFFITDRIKELIKTRGFQVAPAELEELLLGHEAVNDVAVIQRPDEESGELPMAFIVLKPDNDKNAAISREEKMKIEIYDWVKEQVAPHKRLDGGIMFVDTIPKSASGKILRRILRDELAEEMQIA